MLQALVWTRLHTPLYITSPHSLPFPLSDWLFDSIRLISHKANAPQQLERGEARQGKEGGRGSRIHMMRKTASNANVAQETALAVVTPCYTSPLPSCHTLH